MTTRVTVEIPDELARRSRAVAERTHRSFDEVLAEWVARMASHPPVQSLADEEVLALADLQLDEPLSEKLADLLDQQREGRLDDDGRVQLQGLMDVYRVALVRKAEGLREAVGRGLRPRLN